jgi:hypothetical protein
VAWEVYKRQIIRTGEPAVTIGKMGRLGLNMLATAMLQERKVTHVVLLFDQETGKCAVRIATSKDEGAYTLTYNDKSNGSGFSAVTFLNYIRYDWTETRAYSAEWDEDGKMFVFAIPKEYLGAFGTGKLRRSDRLKQKDQEITSVTS